MAEVVAERSQTEEEEERLPREEVEEKLRSLAQQTCLVVPEQQHTTADTFAHNWEISSAQRHLLIGRERQNLRSISTIGGIRICATTSIVLGVLGSIIGSGSTATTWWRGH
jgi:hypothetical protein